MDHRQLTNEIVGAAIEVHKELGPGLLENTYELALAHELSLRGLQTQRQVLLPVTYKELKIEDAYRIDILVNDTVILEIKASDALKPVHNAQLLTYLRLSQKPIGYLLNFHEATLMQGLRRFVHNLQE